MANEATKIELYGANNDGDPRNYTVASGATIAQGAILTFDGDRTVITHAASGAAIAGIASADKSGSDYATTIPAWTNGIFELNVMGPVAQGTYVGVGATANRVLAFEHCLNFDNNASGAHIILGKAVTTAAALGDAVQIRVNL